jgi:hypothetical protein
MHMHVNAKMILVETIPGIGGGGWKRSVEEVDSNMIHLIHCKNLCKCKCHSVPSPSTIKEKNTIK